MGDLKVLQPLREREPAISYRFLLELEGTDPFYVSGGTFPFYEFETFDKLLTDSKIKVPGPQELSDVEIELYENNKNHAYKFFINWRSQIRTESGAYNLPIVYKRVFTIWRKSQADEKIMGLRYTGAWPKKISEYTPKGDNRTEVLVFTVSLSVDDVVPIFLDKVQRKIELDFKKDFGKEG